MDGGTPSTLGTIRGALAASSSPRAEMPPTSPSLPRSVPTISSRSTSLPRSWRKTTPRLRRARPSSEFEEGPYLPSAWLRYPPQKSCAGYGPGHGRSRPLRADTIDWRMGRDSNPRDACTPAGFQDRCLQPLGHPSCLALFSLGGNPARARAHYPCLLYTSDAADDLLCVDLGGRRIIKKK